MNDQKKNRQDAGMLVAHVGRSAARPASGAATPFRSQHVPSEAPKAAGAPVDVDLSRVGARRARSDRVARAAGVVLHRKGNAAIRSRRGTEADRPLSKLPSSRLTRRTNTASLKPRSCDGGRLYSTWAGLAATEERRARAEMGADWPAGFYCPYHQARKFDYAGRVFRARRRRPTLRVPP